MKKGNLRAVNAPAGKGSWALVGAEELDQLRDCWSAYREVTDLRKGPMDPVDALHCTGAILRAVKALVTTSDLDR